MQDWLLQLLRCPITGGHLEVAELRERKGEHVMEGTLHVVGEPKIKYQVFRGVPNLMPEAETDSETRQTLDVFGGEWKDFADWGWVDDPGPNREDALRFDSGLSRDSERDFLKKTGHQAFREMTPRLGRLAIDCGCGNGRFSREAAKYAEKVVAIDASVAAEVAFDNMRRHGIDNVGVVRCSVHNLPFSDEIFDYAFSIGVLQHTGNASRQFREMARVIPLGQRLSVNCYGTGTLIYETVDSFLRRRTTKLSQEEKLKFADRLARLDRRLLMGGRSLRKLEKFLRRLIVIRPTLVQMYDWYAPETAEHYEPEDLRRFFDENGLRVLAATYPVTADDYDDAARKRNAGSYCFLLEKLEVERAG